MTTARAPWILPIIVIAQFFCTSLWFAGNAVIDDLIFNFGLGETALGDLTSAVQFGFISGTLIFAILTVADRFSPSRVFLVSALIGAGFNALVIWEGHGLASLLGLRFLTGFFLAGIYPVGMKIAADYYQAGLGKSLGFLVGALVLGTAFPHLLKAVPNALNWQGVVLATSALAALGGILMWWLVPDGPFRKPSQKPNFGAFYQIFRKPAFRAAAFGYFGHMWELYAFWAFVPVMLNLYMRLHPGVSFDVPLLSFLVIGVGGLGCVTGGYLSLRFGARNIAFAALSLSLACCLLSPFVFAVEGQLLFVLFLVFWGMVVVADSPLFSTLVAHNSEAKIKGTALTMVNSIGFLISILSIQFLNYVQFLTDSRLIYAVLGIGPVLGLWALGVRKPSD
jgi:MFS family permease